MSLNFNDAALARTLGTSDPAQIQALKDLLNDPHSDVALTPIDVVSDDPVYAVATPDEEVDRILAKYLRPGGRRL